MGFGWNIFVQNEYYTAMIGAKPMGINGASLLWMASSTNIIGYEKTDGNPGTTFLRWISNRDAKLSVGFMPES